MRRIVVPVTALAAAALLAAGVARAITYGQPDGPAHPYLGSSPFTTLATTRAAAAGC